MFSHEIMFSTNLVSMQLPWFSDTYAISGGWILIRQDENFNDKAVIMIGILTGVQIMFGTIQNEVTDQVGGGG